MYVLLKLRFQDASLDFTIKTKVIEFGILSLNPNSIPLYHSNHILGFYQRKLSSYSVNLIFEIRVPKTGMLHNLAPNLEETLRSSISGKII